MAILSLNRILGHEVDDYHDELPEKFIFNSTTEITCLFLSFKFHLCKYVKICFFFKFGQLPVKEWMFLDNIECFERLENFRTIQTFNKLKNLTKLSYSFFFNCKYILYWTISDIWYKQEELKKETVCVVLFFEGYKYFNSKSFSSSQNVCHLFYIIFIICTPSSWYFSQCRIENSFSIFSWKLNNIHLKIWIFNIFLFFSNYQFFFSPSLKIEYYSLSIV